MDIYVTNIPQRFNQKQLESYFRNILKGFGILAFSCEKLKNKTCARLMIHETSLAYDFLCTHGTPPNITKANVTPLRPLMCNGQILKMRCNNRDKPDALLLDCLAKESAERKLVENQKPSNTAPEKSQHTFQTLQPLHCGMWDYRQGNLFFQSCFQDFRLGTLMLGRKGLVIIQHAGKTVSVNTRINVPYYTIDSIALGSHTDPTVTFTLKYAPVFWEIKTPTTNEEVVMAKFTALTMTGQRRETERESKVRVCGLSFGHSTTAASCLVYRIAIADPTQLNNLKKILNNLPFSPGCIPWLTSLRDYRQAFIHDLEILRRTLQNPEQFGTVPFTMKFQLQRLAQNGYLSSRKVLKLLPSLQLLLKDFEQIALVEAFRSVARTLPYPGPSADESKFAVKTLLSAIKEKASTFTRAGSVYEHIKRHSHLGLIHKVNVTPAATYLEGPDLETKNRVLRKYPHFADHFIRVIFTDEDFNRVQTPFDVSSEVIYRERFRDVLINGIEIAGRLFKFLGFSHSSLRAQSCWFMSPFVQNGSLIHSSKVIENLGDFSKIFSPAKCAARIGQTFSDATDSIQISHKTEQKIPDIIRLDGSYERCFTDGVGTISEQLLHRVWKEFSRTRKQRATLLQIRFKGAKGMLALDPSLQGEKICLRPSMVKFEGSKDQNLEICGAAYKPLPMYLNRDFVKILEDLGVPVQAFLNLQRRAVKKLQDIIQGPINAARFLEVNRVGLTTRLPTLIRQLGDFNIDFQKDTFLKHIVQMTALVQLRDMKYRARIPVENGLTLYGVVDETGYLKEGEVYISTRKSDGTRFDFVGPVVVTRAPARHPGDVQVATAIKYPEHLPLAKLHNCIVFSQRGARDLPSQLSGGDLDGDLFQIIYDGALWPKRIAQPADYPRAEPVNIGRKVETNDIIDFFLTFMQTDQLGRICNAHTQIADQKPEGTFDPVCINLAEMASVAVDYSKTGIPVDLKRFPKDRLDYSRNCKPDFMADGPRLIIAAELNFEAQDRFADDEPDALSLIDPDTRPVHFYESKKALGQLFRDIDEKEFLKNIQDHKNPKNAERVSTRLPMNMLWDYVQRTITMIQWHHQCQLARTIRDDYEDNLYNTMCQYSPHPKECLSELEVFCGTILGKGGNLPSHRDRDAGFDMKDKFGRDVAWTIEWIKNGDVNGDDEAAWEEEDDDDEMNNDFGSVAIGGTNEALERSIACFAVAMEEDGKRWPGVGLLTSFKYVAGAVCLREVERFKAIARIRRRVYDA